MARQTTRTRSKGSGSLFKRKGEGPWLMHWYDHTGSRKERSTRTTDKAVAERILAKTVGEVALRREGVIDANQDRHSKENRRPISSHVAEYITHCRRREQKPRHVDQKERELTQLLKETGVARLSDLTADALELRLHNLRAKGRSARTVNVARQHAVAFMAWCVDTGRRESNPLRTVPKLNEARDRRRVRRALTDQELASLLEVASEYGRAAWYLAAALAGLRKGDLQGLAWRDVDFEAGTITIRDGKAKREDVIPMNAELAEALRERRAGFPGMSGSKVFPETVTDRTRQKDFLRAGLARVEEVKDSEGNPVMVGKTGKVKTRIVTEDEEGRVIDLHAMRTTLGTNLARSGVAPQVARKIMRHANYETTLSHYTVLTLEDAAGAVDSLPRVGPAPKDEALRATGTLGAAEDVTQQTPDSKPQPLPQQLGRDSVRIGAAERVKEWEKPYFSNHTHPPENASGGALCAVSGQKAVERLNGLEPSTFSLGSWGSWRGHGVLLGDMRGQMGTGVLVARGGVADMRGQSRTLGDGLPGTK